jgi:hypothetical protein
LDPTHKNDFAAEAVVPLVEGIGAVVASLSFHTNERRMGPAYTSANYLQRAFCVLELYAAVVGGATLVFLGDLGIKDLAQILAPEPQLWGDGDGDDSDFEAAHDVSDLWLGPVNCEAAKARSQEHKAQIDHYIANSVGFWQMDQAISTAIMKSAWDAGSLPA